MKKDEKIKDPMKPVENEEANTFSTIMAGGPKHGGGFASSLAEKPITSFRDLKVG